MQLPNYNHYPNFSAQAMKEIPFTDYQASFSLGSSPSAGFDAIQRVIQHSFRSSRILVQQIETLDDHLHPIRLVRLSDGSRLTLKLPPRASAGLLRHERHALETEARVLSNLNRYNDLPLPRLIKYEVQGPSNLMGSSFLLTSSIRGLNLNMIQPYLSATDRQSIDRRLGLITSTISSQTSPFFGPVLRVASGSGFRSWREAFLSLLESVLRDAEDALIQLPYEQIRIQMNRLTPCLEDVPVARLVVPSLGNPANVLIDPDTRHIAGLVDFGTALWGDVLMTEMLEAPSIAFFEGFGSMAGTSGSERLRKLLYICYRSINTIVTHYYRNRNDEGEMQGRMALTRSLGDMSEMEY